MAQHPLARTDGFTWIQADDVLVVQDAAGYEAARLSPLEAEVWRSADGRTPAAALASRHGDAEAVWRALDRLADLGLLERRVTPPGSLPDLSRRKLLTRAAQGSLASLAAVAASSMALSAAAAAANATAATHTKSPEHAGGSKTRLEAVRPKHRRRRPHGHGPG